MKPETSIAGIVRRATILVFAAAILIGSTTFYVFFSAASMHHVEDEARALLGLAKATRTYTIENISPLLDQLPDGSFNSEQVPSFAAQEVFRKFVSKESDYTYREAALNPTNPLDLADRFEVELIAEFSRDRDERESKGIRRIDGDPYFYIARPIEIQNAACLECHSTPDAAPAAMVDRYGAKNGFGWKMGEIIGVQMLTIPIAEERQSVFELVAIVFAMLILLFILTSLMVTIPLQRAVIQPLRQLADVADRSSLRDDSATLPSAGAVEIRKLSEAIARLRTSLNLSIKPPGDPE